MNDELELKGKTTVITGATSGIGLAAATALAGQGALIIGTGRSAARAEAARQAILAAHQQARVNFLIGDLASQREVRTLAESIRRMVAAEEGGSIDVLVNNAGMVTEWFTATEDGYETQFAVNHLAVFLLSLELLPLLQQAPQGRVITVSSASHRNMRMHWKDVMYRRGYNTLLAYKQSKLANILFTTEFNRRYADSSNIRAYAVDPGLVNTQIGSKSTRGIVQWFWERRRRKGASTEQGAATVVYLASQASIVPPDAVYWKNCRPKAPSRYSLREDEAARLWSLSERLCGIGSA
jgi:NAD(P)-dependent dehydrogenase (short-subunit alcohol dehydrogenase family)